MQRLIQSGFVGTRSFVLRTCVLAFLTSVVSLLSGRPAQAQFLRDRVSPAASLVERIELPQSGSARAATSTPLGHLAPEIELTSMRLVLQPSAAQQADLTRLLAEQNNPASPSYRQWFTPAQFGLRFGVSDGDLAQVRQWLTAQGFTVESVPPGRNAILFSGNSGQVESAFGTSMQRYTRDGQEFFENSANLKIPAAFGGVVGGVGNLSSYRPKSHAVRSVLSADSPAGARTLRPELTNTTASGTNYYLTPYDFRQIYDLNGLLNSGNNGSGVTIVVAGQSSISTTQIGYFQTLTGQAVKAPTLTLVPNSGVSTAYAGDEGESEIDIEYAGGTAPGANVNFVYTGNGTNSNVFGSVQYAIDNKLAPIISLSYGSCEASVTGANLSTFEYALQQANAQGQTVVASSGDTSAATCDASETASGKFQTAIDGATVSYPASSAYVTGVGGTTLNDVSNPSSYWAAANNSQSGSALGYIPEIAWNDTALIQQALGPTAAYVIGTGGGASKAFGKPSWQTAPGVPADGRRDVPDVSFAASPNIHGYTFCSADTNGTTTAADACTATSFKSIVGGTSLSAPNFAAMLAIIEQTDGITGGLGNVNPLLYGTAASSAGSAAFHDVTSGNNFVACAAGYPDCMSGQLGYATGPGYDLVTGLGSIDGAQFATAIKAAPALASLANVVVSVAPQAPTANASFTASAVVTSNSGTAPTGTVIFSVDGAASAPVTLAAAAATSTLGATHPTANQAFTNGLAVGSHTIIAAYSGDSTYAAASSTVTFTIVPPTVGNFTMTSAPTTLAIATGASGAETLNLASTGGFADIVTFGVSLSGTNASTFPGCASLTKVPVAANSTATAALTIYTTQALCTSKGNVQHFAVASAAPAAHTAARHSPFRPWNAVTLAGLLVACFRFRRSRRIQSLLALMLAAGVLGLSGCGNSSAPLPNPTAPTTPTSAGTYTVTVVGTSASNSAITAKTSFTLTVQ